MAVTLLHLACQLLVSQRTIRRALGNKLVKSLNGKPAAYTIYGKIVKKANKNGLWKHRGFTFSIYRNLKRTLFHLINKSPAGLSANELKALIGMNVWRTLGIIHMRGLVSRVKVGHTNYFFSKNFKTFQRQLRKRYKGKETFRVQLTGEIQEIVFGKAGKVLMDRVRHVCTERGIVLLTREYDIVVANLLRPLLRAGTTDGDLNRSLERKPETKGFFSFVHSSVPSRTEINQIKQKLDSYALAAIFNELVLWIVEQLDLKTISIAIDGTHCHQSRGNTRGTKVHAACILELGLPVGFVLLEDGMEYDLRSLTPVLKQVRALGLKVEFVIGDSLYDDGEFYYEVNRILGAEGISSWKKNRLLAGWSPVNNTLLEFFAEREQDREKVLTEHRLRKQGLLNKRGRLRNIPEAKVSFEDKKLIGDLLRNYPLTEWGSKKKKDLYKKRPVVERLFSILKLWLGLDGQRTKGHSRMWSVFASFISLLVLSILVIITGLSEMLLRIRKFII